MRYSASQLNQEWAPNQADAEPEPADLIAAVKAKGYTREIWIGTDDGDLNLLVKPDVDLDSRFKGYCLDEHEWLRVNGWMATYVEDVEVSAS